MERDPDTPEAAEQPGVPPCVLVIEDETPVANFLADWLGEKGCRVVAAADGDTALELFRSERPDLVICDLLLPGRNGFELVQDFARLAPDVPVVVVTGIYREEAQRSELKTARLFATKPLDDEALAAIERLALAARSGHAAAEAEDDAPPAGSPPRVEPWVPTGLVPLPRMLHVLWSDRARGLLTHRCGDRHVVFTLDDGHVRFVRSNDPEMRLDRVLLQLGRVGEEQLARARAALDERTVRTRLGEVLVEEGALTAEELGKAVQVQLRKIVAQAFREIDGETLFRSGAGHSDEDILIDTDVRALIVAGCSTSTAWGGDDDLIAGHLPDADHLVELGADPGDPDLKLPATLQQLLDVLREPKPLGEVIAMAQLVGLRGRAVAFGLLCAGVLRLAQSADDWEVPEPSLAVSRAWGPDAHSAGVLLRLEDERATGVLTARCGDLTSWVALRDGAITAAGTNDERSRIGQRLIAAGLVAPEQLEMALADQARRPGRPLGRILVDGGVLDAAQLLQAVRAQVLGIARDLLSWAAWDLATFEAGREPASEPIALGASTADVVLEALRTCSVRRLERVVGRLAVDRPRMEVETLGSGRFRLSDTEESVVAALTPDTKELLRALSCADRSDPDVIRMAALALLVTPALHRSEAAVTA